MGGAGGSPWSGSGQAASCEEREAVASVKASGHMWTEQAVAISLESALLSMRSGSSFLPQCGSISGSRDPYPSPGQNLPSHKVGLT